MSYPTLKKWRPSDFGGIMLGIPGSSKCVKFLPFHPKNIPKGRNFTYLEDPGIGDSLPMDDFRPGRLDIFRVRVRSVMRGLQVSCSPVSDSFGLEIGHIPSPKRGSPHGCLQTYSPSQTGPPHGVPNGGYLATYPRDDPPRSSKWSEKHASVTSTCTSGTWKLIENAWSVSVFQWEDGETKSMGKMCIPKTIEKTYECW